MDLISAIANKKFEAKKATRFIEDLQDCIARAKKNIARNLEDVEDSITKAIRKMDRSIDELTQNISVNVDAKLEELYENAANFAANSFLIEMDGILMERDKQSLVEKANAKTKDKYLKDLERAKALAKMSKEELLAISSVEDEFEDKIFSKDVIDSLNNKISVWISENRMQTIETTLSADCPNENIKQEK